MAYTGVNSCIKNGDREGSNKTHSQGFDAERQWEEKKVLDHTVCVFFFFWLQMFWSKCIKEQTWILHFLNI